MHFLRNPDRMKAIRFFLFLVLVLSLVCVFDIISLLAADNNNWEKKRLASMETALRSVEHRLSSDSATRATDTIHEKGTSSLSKKTATTHPKDKWQIDPFLKFQLLDSFDTNRDNSNEDTTSHFLRTEFGVKGKRTRQVDYKLSGILYGFYREGSAVTKKLNLELAEAYLRCSWDKFELSVGRQKLTWGKLDDIFILDIINPQDFRNFFDLDKNDRKIPIWLASLSYFSDNQVLQSVDLVVSFHPRPNRLYYLDEDFAVFDHIKETYTKAAPSAADIINGINIRDEKDAIAFDDMEIMTRFSFYFPSFDMDLIYMNKMDNTQILYPLTEKGKKTLAFLYNPSNNTFNDLITSSPESEDLSIDARCSRIHILGIDGEGTIADWGWRYEGAVIFNKRWTDDNGLPVEKDAFIQGIGIDNQRTDFYCNFQLLHQRVFNYSALYKQKKDMLTIFTQSYWQSKYGYIKIGLDSAFNTQFHDWMLNPYVSYSNQKGLTISLGAQLFNGPPGTLFGTFRDQDYIYLETKLDL